MGHQRKTRMRPLCATTVVVVLAAWALALAACGGRGSNAGTADQRGYVILATLDASGHASSLLIGSSADAQLLGEASVRITDQTAWWQDTARLSHPPTPEQLVGRTVAVKFTGPVAESYPVQATARTVWLIDRPVAGLRGSVLVTGGPAPGAPRPEPNERVAAYWGEGTTGPLAATAVSDAQGGFGLQLAPGVYTLVAQPTDDKTPLQRRVRVQPGRVAQVKVFESVR